MEDGTDYKERSKVLVAEADYAYVSGEYERSSAAALASIAMQKMMQANRPQPPQGRLAGSSTAATNGDRDECPECGNLKSSAYPLCYPCNQKARGSVQCKGCGDGWHDPKYDQCYNCNQAGPSYAEEPYEDVDEMDEYAEELPW